MNIEDTIVAVSSPPGASERGIARLSGPRAIEIADRLFTATTLESHACGLRQASGFGPQTSQRLHGYLTIDADRLAATAWVFPDDRSYTGQPIVEFHLIGSPVVLGLVIESLIASGARRAEAGEFTARAFLSGRIDLSQAHGVAGMIAARSDQQLRAAERLLHGALGRVASDAREALADLLSLVEGAMDFADEPIEFISADELRTRIDTIRTQLRTTVDAGLRAERWGRMPRVVMTGLPNAGKSTLLNRLSRSERAISTPIAGTTRDAIAATIDLGESSFLLVDVAGRRTDLGDGVGGDHDIDRQAAHMAAEAAADADVLLVVVDLAQLSDGHNSLCLETAIGGFVSTDSAKLVVGNKSDLVTESQIAALQSWARQQVGCDMIAISAATGAGCDALRERLRLLLSDADASSEQPIIALMAEHREALESALTAIDRAATKAANCGAELQDADLVAAELRIAAEALGVLVGMDQTEEMLGRVFSRFCVGK